MESLASLDLPAYGYGIRYVNGMFRQRIDDGYQVELPENWLQHGNPWEFERRESAYFVGFGGEVVGTETAMSIGRPARRWRRSRSTRRWSAGAASGSTPSASGPPARSIPCGSTGSTTAISRARWPGSSAPRR